jgi:hypothetical protein
MYTKHEKDYIRMKQGTVNKGFYQYSPNKIC